MLLWENIADIFRGEITHWNDNRRHFYNPTIFIALYVRVSVLRWGIIALRYETWDIRIAHICSFIIRSIGFYRQWLHRFISVGQLESKIVWWPHWWGLHYNEDLLKGAYKSLFYLYGTLISLLREALRKWAERATLRMARQDSLQWWSTVQYISWSSTFLFSSLPSLPLSPLCPYSILQFLQSWLEGGGTMQCYAISMQCNAMPYQCGELWACAMLSHLLSSQLRSLAPSPAPAPVLQLIRIMLSGTVHYLRWAAHLIQGSYYSYSSVLPLVQLSYLILLYVKNHQRKSSQVKSSLVYYSLV